LGTRADDLGESVEEVGARSRELIATDEPAVVAKQLLDTIIMEDGQSDGGLPDPSCTDESDGPKVFGKADDRFDQLVTSEQSLGGGGGSSPVRMLYKGQTVVPRYS